MAFFAYLPKIEYDILGDDVKKLVPDIFRRIKIRNKIKDNFMLFDRV